MYFPEGNYPGTTKQYRISLDLSWLKSAYCVAGRKKNIERYKHYLQTMTRQRVTADYRAGGSCECAMMRKHCGEITRVCEVLLMTGNMMHNYFSQSGKVAF